MTKAYLLQLEGMGDHVWVILNQTDWNFIEQCCDWMSGDPIPTPPESLIQDLMEDKGISREEVLEALTPDQYSRSYDNDVVLQMVGSLFNGERFRSYDASIKEVNDFVAKHSLDLEEAYEGYVY